MRILMIMLLAIIAGCTTTNVDESIRAAAPKACGAVTLIHTAYVTSELGSAKDKASVDAAWTQISNLCADPTTITAEQLVIVAIQTAVIVKAARKVNVNG